ncbi:MAG TPA: DUF47 family protein [Methanoregulaceae archaeon]|jgi:hypothetical protein|nr:DUF47 family protein [Methanoregulaceae archaeon]MDD3092124.1 DUF47 family protein [Methanoregulaceae archaeon]MDD5685947.1 DUF47 family protein [Methanoregulaceae archaeon]HPJ74540.1 DUF47 family protein [Methanoregulaceae archaeon]HPQ76293.1 DUF47 family protein [Methanoregulaceae archaeon]
MTSGKRRGRIEGIFSSIFPAKYDFEEMLSRQADRTLTGVKTLSDWLMTTPLGDPVVLKQMENEVDSLRYDLEEKLIDAFSTPFDRQDIYSLSRQMDYILNYTAEIAKEMYVFGVEPDEPIREMTRALLGGTRCMAEGVRVMNTDQKRVRRLIRRAREAMHRIEDHYIESMGILLNSDDALGAMKKREIYHHLRDAGRALRYTVDILHKAVVGIDIGSE